MTIEEQSLRELLASTYGEYCGRAILECIENGDELVITLKDGSALTLSTMEGVKLALKQRFNWQLPRE